MGTTKYLTRTLGTLKITHTTKEREKVTENKLINSKINVTPTEPITKKKTNNSLFFQMYSEENGALFI